MVCGEPVDARGTHHLHCVYGGGVIQWNNDYVRERAAIVHAVTGALVKMVLMHTLLHSLDQGRSTREGQVGLVMATRIGGSEVSVFMAFVSPVNKAIIRLAVQRDRYSATQ